MSDFKVGDVVQPKSGGPKMTINRIVSEDGREKLDQKLVHEGYKEGDVLCEWFEGDVLKRHPFKHETIKAL